MKRQKEHAMTARRIKIELKIFYPETSFELKSPRYSRNGTFSIQWVDGPSPKEVSRFMEKYKLKFLELKRETSNEVLENVFQWLKDTHIGFENLVSYDEKSEILKANWATGNAREYIEKILRDENLTFGFRHLQKTYA